LKLFHSGTEALRDSAKVVSSLHGYLHIGLLSLPLLFCPFIGKW
jgi:hypothetical protein